MTLSKELISTAIDYKTYKGIIESLWKDGKSTGPIQNEELLHYTELNIHRMNRVEKTTQLTEELKSQLVQIKKPQIWLILAEGWCGDAAQTIPVFNVIEKEFPIIQTKLLFRDENLELMDQFLTNGGRSIPKVLLLDAATLDLIAQWGPRPEEATKLIYELKEADATLSEIKEKLHLWYAKNKSIAVQEELTTILKTNNK